eukprot:TRINITY_DN48012_c0_g1_i1.p1 TRINITY_DN48012_c0_g1~~TRINITY_DN48012_c0_g1_i1.p1  ORF type:complete len:487 (+),score=38.80 TRINITY_DN48012_c0_g1_i1:80-1540(+)
MGHKNLPATFDSVVPQNSASSPKKSFLRSPLVNRLKKKGDRAPAAAAEPEVIADGKYTQNVTSSCGSRHEQAASVPPTPSVPPPKTPPRVSAKEEDEVKELICQHAYSLRKNLFKLANEAPSMERSQFLDHVEKTLKFSPHQRTVLESLLTQHGQDRGDVTFSRFETSLKKQGRQDNEHQYAVEINRFMRPGIMDRKLQKVVQRSNETEDENRVLLTTARENNQLGASVVQPPYAVMGDSERMGGIISAYLEAREDTLKNAMDQYSDSGGNIAYADFQKALLKYDKCTSQSEMDDLMTVLDPRKKGFFSIDKFLSAYGQEYIKKRSQRSTGGNPLAWTAPNEYNKQKVLEDLRKRKRQPKRIPRPKPTLTSNMRKAIAQHNTVVANGPQKGSPNKRAAGTLNLSTMLSGTGIPTSAFTQSARVVRQYPPHPPNTVAIGVGTTSSLGSVPGSTNVNVPRPPSSHRTSVTASVGNPEEWDLAAMVPVH